MTMNSPLPGSGDADDWLDATVLAKNVGVRRDTVLRWARDGRQHAGRLIKLRSVMIGNKRRFHVDDVAAFFAAFENTDEAWAASA